jgi:hypothetical protein
VVHRLRPFAQGEFRRVHPHRLAQVLRPNDDDRLARGKVAAMSVEERDIWQLDRPDGRRAITADVYVNDLAGPRKFRWLISLQGHRRSRELIKSEETWQTAKTARNRAYWLLLSLGFYSHEELGGE